MKSPSIIFKCPVFLNDFQLTVKTLQLGDGRMIQAAKFGQMEEAAEAIELTEEEKNMEARLRVIRIDHYFCIVVSDSVDS